MTNYERALLEADEIPMEELEAASNMLNHILNGKHEERCRRASSEMFNTDRNREWSRWCFEQLDAEALRQTHEDMIRS